ncbi:unnamed protein product [Owenia fusiformis]|uniref:SEC7 domain-containing protein n=1 Tax=Owenia fusiformis TaxID=6347 RepID=A0A8S4NMW2_OWEFU|nr:unnamed protein product [Owenia fusiformis]
MATNHSRMESTMFARQQYMEINKLRKNLGQDENFMKAATPQHARQTLRQGTISSTSGQEHIYMRKPLQRGQGMDLSNGHPVGHGHAKPHPTGPPTKARPPPPMPKRTSSATKKPIRDLPIRQQPHEETNNNRNSYPELNDSSASASPADTPSESTIDLPSVNFENLLESKETDILSDSFHSDLSSLNSSSNVSQQQANNSHEQGMYPNSQGSSQSSLTSRHSQERTLTRDSDSSQRSSDNLNSPMEFDQSDRSYERFRSHCSAGSLDSDSFLTDVQIKVEGPTPTEENVEEDTFDIDNIEYPAPMELIKVYANTEVKLRNNRWRQQSGDSNKTLTNDSHYNGDPIIEEECISEVGTTQGRGPHASPIWKRKQGGGPGPSPQARSIDTSHNNLGNHGTCSQGSLGSLDDKRMSNISEASEPDSLEGAVSSSPSSDNISMGSEHSMGTGYQKLPPNMVQPPLRAPPKISDKQRKRQYRIGLNLFNKKPDKGIWYLIERRFLEHSPSAVARFLISRKGLSKYHIGDYLGNLQNDFNMDCLDCFVDEIDLSGLSIDVALRKFQTFFRMPGEAQKIERLMDAFAHRYCICNSDTVKNFHSADTVFLLAFAIIMLNTDLHNSSIKQERKMKVHEFIKNLRGIDEGCDVDRDMLVGIYERVKAHEFKSGTDHVTQVQKVEQTIVGKKPQLSLPHRRLVCYCRLYEVHDPNKKEKLGLHQREVFLFNDILVVTKIFNKKKSAITYTFRNSFNLCGMLVYPFDTPHYQHGIRLTTNIDGKVLMTFNARNEHDRTKFMEDLREAILEMNEMEAIRIEEELQRQKMVHNFTTTNLEFNRRSNDSGVVDIELLKPTENGSLNRLSAPEVNGGLKKSTLSNSLIDLADSKYGGGRRGSAGSLDSGMASTAGSVTGREDSPQPPGGATSKSNKQQPNPGQSGGMKLGFFSKKKSKSSARTQSDCSDA